MSQDTMRGGWGTSAAPLPAPWECAGSEGLTARGFPGWKTYGWVRAGPGGAEQLRAGLAGGPSLLFPAVHRVNRHLAQETSELCASAWWDSVVPGGSPAMRGEIRPLLLVLG